MSEKKDYLDKLIAEELKKDAEEIEKDLQGFDGDMPADAEDRIYANLKKQIEDYEWEQRYASLSEEDREALRLGQKMMKQKKTSYSRRSRKVYVALAAVLVLVIAVGITSFGGAERIVAFMKSMVGEREVVKVNSSEDNLVIVEENEEEAYEAIKDEFGVEPVRVMVQSDDMKFNKMELEKGLQVAELTYLYDNEKIVYLISASYRDSSWGIDVEDDVTDQYNMEKKGCIIEVKEYETPESKTKRYSASFNYMGLEYFLMGTLEKEEFELIVEKLYFIAD